MKNVLLILGLGVIALHYGDFASACSPPPPAYAQQASVSKVLNSNQFRNALDIQVQSEVFVSIQQIDFSNAVNVHLSNGCTIKGFVEYYPPTHPGLCPEFKGVRTETVCQNQ